MAGIEQKNIDELLNSITETDDLDENSETFIIEEKIYKPPRKPILKFNTPYKSPVVKSENLIYNPESNICCSEEKVVVRDLNNYMKYISRNNKKQI